MRAARWHGRNDVRVETVPDPTPNPGDVIIRVMNKPFVMCLDIERASGKIRRNFFLNDDPN